MQFSLGDAKFDGIFIFKLGRNDDGIRPLGGKLESCGVINLVGQVVCFGGQILFITEQGPVRV